MAPKMYRAAISSFMDHLFQGAVNLYGFLVASFALIVRVSMRLTAVSFNSVSIGKHYHIWWGNLMLASLWSSGHWGEKQVSSAEWFAADRFQFAAWSPILYIQRQQVTTRPLFCSLCSFFFLYPKLPRDSPTAASPLFTWLAALPQYIAAEKSVWRCGRARKRLMFRPVRDVLCEGQRFPPPSPSVCTLLLFSWGLQNFKVDMSPTHIR